jgi:hypothetical protein
MNPKYDTTRLYESWKREQEAQQRFELWALVIFAALLAVIVIGGLLI